MGDVKTGKIFKIGFGLDGVVDVATLSLLVGSGGLGFVHCNGISVESRTGNVKGSWLDLSQLRKAFG